MPYTCLMATITFRLTDDEKAALELSAFRLNQSVSDYIRQTLALRDELNGRVEKLWGRVDRLEQIAGL